MSFTCIYCLQSQPTVKPSDAHVFPYAIGGTSSAPDTVCAECNHRVNRDVEMPALPMFRVFQSLHGVKGRRGKVPRVRATLKVEGLETNVTLRDDGQPSDAIVRVETDDHGRKRYVVYG